MVALAHSTATFPETSVHVRAHFRSCISGPSHCSKPSDGKDLRGLNYRTCDRLEPCSRDPIGYEGSPWNLYEYVAGGVVNHTDPEGLIGPWEPRDPRRDPHHRPRLPPNFHPKRRPPKTCRLGELLDDLARRANRRRGNGPYEDSAQHCWFACRVMILGHVAACMADVAEILDPSGDAMRDFLANHTGGNCGLRLTFCDGFVIPIRDFDGFCDKCCKTFPN